ncbi:hypothetical protein Lesp02_48270 [Lentzea sp. NBRC 105346]|uniref:DUF6474 family protein n=1 Tax=Lentzea sp. NBRC 105346 TaxID=3032205 RepID=UPI0024A381E3|nr:DUF6474 family protein [Lentzea sp. NBRC 105346]GLZ32639.1 hypothetical protein Lesp02_48270 [Lentzea sp. NBRC 105346]
MARKEGPRLTPKSAKNMVGVAKVVAPALIPVLAPVLARGASVLSDRYDRYRARRLGVDVADIGQYTGRGARLHARITGFAEALEELRAKEPDYVWTTESRLSKLTAAVRAAERMPTARRKAAHRAVATDLDVLEADLLRRLGVS